MSQRIIKFRVWCKDYNEWEKNRCFINQQGELLHEMRTGFMLCNPDTHIVQLFTGLLDKNGKEIYEGDVLQRIPCLTQYQIIWDNDMSCYRMKAVDPAIIFSYREPYGHDWQVIGNIYENSDLVEVKG